MSSLLSPDRSRKVATATADKAPNRAGKASFRLIAAWEAVKGVLVLLAAGLAVKFLAPSQTVEIEDLVRHFHLNPAGHTSKVFERALDDMTNTRLVLLALGALVYALVRFAEAYGLWFQKRWGWVLGIAGAAIYLPFEVIEMVRHFTITSVMLFVVNLAIVALLWHFRTRHGA